jgi:hypothetical protein
MTHLVVYIEDAISELSNEHYVTLNVKDCQNILSELVKLFGDWIMSEWSLDEVYFVSFD